MNKHLYEFLCTYVDIFIQKYFEITVIGTFIFAHMFFNFLCIK